MPTHCIFCNTQDDALIYRDEDGIVVVDDPVRPGHVLVGARVHSENLTDLTAQDAAGLMRLANRVGKRIIALTGAQKLYVTAIGDKDKHFHVHLLPKFVDEPNLGPHIFGPAGWISFLPSAPNVNDLHKINDGLRKALTI